MPSACTPPSTQMESQNACMYAHAHTHFNAHMHGQGAYNGKRMHVCVTLGKKKDTERPGEAVIMASSSDTQALHCIRVHWAAQHSTALH